VASSKTRQRKLARAKMDRQNARRAARLRRTRQIQAGVAAGVALLVVVLGTVWALGGFSSKPKKVGASPTCVWNKPANTSTLKDVGQPPTSGEPRAGVDTMTITTNLGTITASLDLAKAPCTASSFHYLAGKGFFTNTKCYKLTTGGPYALYCGDPNSNGTGGPTYRFANEYVPTPLLPSASAAPSAAGSAAAPSGSAAASPTAASPTAASPTAAASAAPSASPSQAMVTYIRGSLVMANDGPDTNGSRFFIVYKDSQLPASYTLFGSVNTGLDVVEKVAGAGAEDSEGKATADGAPKTDLTIQSVSVTLPNETVPAPSGSAVPSAAPSGSVAPKSSSSGSPSPAARS
jgi:peptidyl-prolyl cis-trans isomerase B (cyclophilin B)